MTPSSGRERTIDICVCTFRRPELAATLRSIAALDLPAGFSVGIVVADNDDEPSAEPLVERLASEIRLPVRYRHFPARNISVARNGCLEVSRARYIAFIDDDETATPQWLSQLMATLEREEADAVLGPVRAVYGNEAPTWMKAGDFHSTFPVWVKGAIRTGYTCNVLLQMDAPSIAGRRFSLARGQSGGEDTEFFDAVTRDGGRIGFAAHAWVEEIVPPARATFGWLARRRFRVGQTHGHLLRGRLSGPSLPGQLALASAKAGYCLLASMLTAASPVRRNRNMLRGIMHAGAVSGLLGLRELRQYGVTRQFSSTPARGQVP